jgi:hypothetical protein
MLAEILSACFPSRKATPSDIPQDTVITEKCSKNDLKPSFFPGERNQIAIGPVSLYIRTISTYFRISLHESRFIPQYFTVNN